MNGGELDGARILSKARLNEMMAPQSSTPAGYLGLVFFGGKVADRDAIGHDGETMTFFSDLRIFPAQGIGVFVSRDGIGDITAARQIPQPVAAIARRFLPRAATPDVADPRRHLADNADIAGIYQTSRRAESTFVRLTALLSQFVIKIDSAGDARSFAATWPFGKGEELKRLERNLYLTPGNVHMALVGDGPESYLTQPAASLAARSLARRCALDRAGAGRERGGGCADAAGMAGCSAMASLAQTAMERGPRRSAHLSRGTGWYCWSTQPSSSRPRLFSR